MTPGSCIRVLFWNTWLLRPHLWPGGPVLPFADRIAPDVPARAIEVGRALAGRFDVMALAECFEPDEQQAVLAAWQDRSNVDVATGPGPSWSLASPAFTGSGLMTIVDGLTIDRTASMRFEHKGDRLRDVDTLAAKGVLLAEVAAGPDGPSLEVFSTHLFAGGDLLPLPGAGDGQRRHRVRMSQVDELLAVVEQHHREANVTLVVGDFNIREDRRSDLTERMNGAGLLDVWATHGRGAAQPAISTRIIPLLSIRTSRMRWPTTRRRNPKKAASRPATGSTTCSCACRTGRPWTLAARGGGRFRARSVDTPTDRCQTTSACPWTSRSRRAAHPCVLTSGNERARRANEP